MMTSCARPIAVSLAVAALALGGAPAAAADVYDLDPAHSYAVFQVNHLGFGTSWGRFNDLSGTFTIDEENPAASSVKIEIKAASVDTNNPQRDEHLRKPDFFNAAQFPLISFKSTSVKKSGESEYTVGGDLTLRGVTKPLSVTLQRHQTGADPWGNTRTGFDTTFLVKRSEFGVSYMPQGLSEEVRVMISVEGIKKK